MSESKKDSLQRFVFDEIDARGCIVQLQDTCDDIQSTHYYPPNLARVVNQFTAAVALLRDSIKLDASVTIQLRSPGSLSLIMADSLPDRSVRAIAEYDVQALSAGDDIDFKSLGEGAVLAITISPEKGERHQAIVPIEHSSLEECLEDYFARSEQLPTWFCLLSSEAEAVGIAIHALPDEKTNDKQLGAEHFNRLRVLLKTLTIAEARELDSQEILTRLFHEESCRLFEAKEVKFGCQCSRDKSIDALKALGKEDLDALVSEQKEQGKKNLVVDCHFCFQRYEFDFKSIGTLLKT
jgi:molecular chaperone Hsp33